MTPNILTPQAVDRIVALLDRLDPHAEGACGVAGCIHHTHHEPLTLAAAGAGTV